MKRNFLSYIAVFTLLIVGASAANAQLRLPRPSQKASVMQTLGVTDITIVYSRPGVKGRTIWGDPPADIGVKGEATLDNQNTRPEGMAIVPNGHVWRTGANDATQFSVTDDVLINGQKLAAGDYSLHTIPGKTEWIIIFNSVANQGGSFSYDAAKDALRVKAKPQMVSDNQEWLSFTIDPMSENSAQVQLRWEKLALPFSVEVANPTATVLQRARPIVATAKSDDWQTPFGAANYAKNNKSMDDAKKWYDQAIAAIDEQIKAKETFDNLSRKSLILVNAGRGAEALAVTEKAIARGKADKVDTSALEKRAEELKASNK